MSSTDAEALWLLLAGKQEKGIYGMPSMEMRCPKFACEHGSFSQKHQETVSKAEMDSIIFDSICG